MKTLKMRTFLAAAVALAAFIAMFMFVAGDVYAETTWSADQEITANTTYTDRVYIDSDGVVTLTIQEGVTVTAEKGIGVPKGISLTIQGGGTLIANGSEYDAGIGGTANNGNPTSGPTESAASGNITINGCTVKATGGKYAAGIGGGSNGIAEGQITINGGTVIAKGDDYAAGIGGGASGSAEGQITINGGTVTANSGKGGAGIGGGNYKGAKSIVINGGNVTANGSQNGGGGGAGIGCGAHVSDEFNYFYITISGGVIRATGYNGAAGIGEGSTDNDHCAKGNVTITGGQITAKSSPASNQVGIGMVGKNVKEGEAVTISLSLTNATDYVDTPFYNGTVTLQNRVYSESENTVIPAGEITDNSSLGNMKIVPIADGYTTITGDWQKGSTTAQWVFVDNADHYEVQAKYQKNKNENPIFSNRVTKSGTGSNTHDFINFISNNGAGSYSAVVRAYDETGMLIGFGSIEPTQFYKISIEKKSFDSSGAAKNTNGGYISFGVDGSAKEVLHDSANGNITIYRPVGKAKLEWSAYSKEGFIIDSFTVDGAGMSGNKYEFDLNGNHAIKAVFKNTTETKTIKLDAIHESVAETILGKIKNGDYCEINDTGATCVGTVITAHVNAAWTIGDIREEFAYAISDAFSGPYYDNDSKDVLYPGIYSVGSKRMTEYSNRDEFEQDNEENEYKVAENDKVFYAFWMKPVSSIDLKIDAPLCGTVVTTDDSDQSTQSHPPVIHELDNVEIGGGYWLKSYSLDDSTGRVSIQYLNDLISGGESYKTAVFIQPGFGYYFADKIEENITINGANVESAVGGAGSAMVIGNVTAAHNYVNGVCRGCGALKPDDPQPTPGPAPSVNDPVKKVIDLINMIPDPVTEKDTDAVQDARDAYEKLTDRQKEDSRLTDEVLKKLTDAEAAIEAAKRKAADQAAANGFNDVIAGLPVDESTWTREQLNSALAAYNDLTDAQKALVDPAALAKMQTVEFNFASSDARAKKVKLKSVTAKKGRKAQVKWTKNSKVAGYQLVYSTSRKFTKKTTKKVTIKSNKTVKKTIKKLRKGKTYYFKVRPYTKVYNGATRKKVTVYGKWSSVKKCKAKK